ncbi:MAG TPA: N-acetyltransferase [Bryobacteraceae bacterium]|nr:N-acetyltransferase [Bryobacteraceae bacterium]
MIPAKGKETFDIRKASMFDISDLLVLINSHAAKGIMLPRTEFEMAENVRDFSVIQSQGRLIGCGALHFYTPHAAEVRSLAIDPGFQGAGAGRALVLALIEEAQAFQVKDVFAFTYVPDFFRKLGFLEIERGDLPLKAWKDCLRCPKFQCCDEIAVVKHLQMDGMGVDDTLTRVQRERAINPPNPEIAFPILNKVR